MTDAGYVLGGYGVTVVAISGYIAHMWVRNRAVTRLRGSGPVAAPPDGEPAVGGHDGRP